MSSIDPDPAGPVMEPRLERAGKRLGHSATWFLALMAALWVPAIIVVILSVTWVGVLLFLLGGIPGGIGLGLLGSAVVSRWSARHRSFA